MSKEAAFVYQTYTRRFDMEPIIVHSPGRINLIGEHTDYNGGFVLPAAIDLGITFAVGKSGSSVCRLYAIDMEEAFEFDLKNLTPSDLGWPNYFMGVVQQILSRALHIEGFNCVFGGNIPIGAGMSSSAAMECGLSMALNELFDLGLTRMEMAQLSQKAENEFVGVKCGIMDQFTSLMGKDKQVIKLDCRSLEYTYYPFDAQTYSLVMCNTGVSHSLASSEYNTRRMQCEQGVAMLRKYQPSIFTLRDVSAGLLEAHKDELGELLYRRCRYVLEENKRVIDCCESLLADDMDAFGANMYRSHDGLQHDYEVSCIELDFLVDSTRDMDIVLGSRMMGGGFGGCTINLVRTKDVESFTRQLKEKYKAGMDRDLPVYKASISEGTKILSLDRNIETK